MKKHKYNAVSKKGFRSSLEEFCSKTLNAHKVPFEYETIKYILVPAIEYPSIEKIGKTFKYKSKNLPITYTPDFVCPNGKWIIETKGLRTKDFDLKWKLFKKHLVDNNLSIDLYMPTNQKEVIECINLINSNGLSSMKSEELDKHLKKKKKKTSS